MLPQSLIFLDLETTGMAAAQERITEIGLVEVAEGEFVGSWSQLVNPQKSIPPFIQSLTGISNRMVRMRPGSSSSHRTCSSGSRASCSSPTTRASIMASSRPSSRAWAWPTTRACCTAKLSRRLFPEHRRHNLDSLIERHGLGCSARHRALGDAEVLWQFLRKIHAEVDAARIDAALKAQLDAPGLADAA